MSLCSSTAMMGCRSAIRSSLLPHRAFTDACADATKIDALGYLRFVPLAIASLILPPRAKAPSEESNSSSTRSFWPGIVRTVTSAPSASPHTLATFIAVVRGF